MLDVTLSILILIGGFFTFIGSLGLARMPDFHTRLHGPTKATTLGVGALLIASMIHFSVQGAGVSLHEILVTLFLFITAPVSAHLLSKAALHLRVRSLARVPQVVEDADVKPEVVEAPDTGREGGSQADSSNARVMGPRSF